MPTSHRTQLPRLVATRRAASLALLGLSLFCANVPACVAPVSLCDTASPGSFALVRDGVPAAVLIDASANAAVKHVADFFAADLQRVSGTAPRRLSEAENAAGELVLIGVIGESAMLDTLVRSGALRVDDIAGQWEAFAQVVVERPFPNVARALVIAGADRRGAVFGSFDVSEKMGVSPWHWFADVPVARRADVFVMAGARHDQPKVKYRGFFINDEDPAFKTWGTRRFGGINAKLYAHVFELLLRMKGNYLWPAMWGKAFNDDDPQNTVLADAMGVVMGSSHHEPMTRAQIEWHRNVEGGVTGGAWNYASNAANLQQFWRGGMQRMMSKGGGQAYDSLVTIGMRGDGDEAMAEGTAIPLLEQIVADQRRIIAEETGKPAERTPQMWALYKEVQDYYDHGMQVPDDVTLLFADDNWGQIRRLPVPGSARAGGYGVYYHFDYVGGPRNYKWLNTVQIQKTWQQMDLAWAHGARSIWIVNVGDIKPMEFPLGFFMAQAWDPPAMTPEALARYPRAWARATFGAPRAERIAHLVTRYAQLAARRKPELLDASTFALGASVTDELDGGAFGAVVAEWQRLERELLDTKATLAPEQHDAFFQLVEHPIIAFSNLYQLYYSVAWNRRLAAANDARANAFAEQAERAYRRDREISDVYHALNGGKWDGMMLQTHIGYTNWQQPETQTMPEVRRVAGTAAIKPIVFGTVTTTATGDIVLEAPHYSRAVNSKTLSWRSIAHLGHTLGTVTALPQGQPATSERDGVRLEYDVTLARAGEAMVQLVLVPTLDVGGTAQLRVGVSLDDGPVQVLIDRQLPAPTTTTVQEQRNWNRAVIENARTLEARFPGTAVGRHTVKVWRLDDNVLLQRVVVRH